MVETNYSPDRGDIVWISLDPTLGRELQKRRPDRLVLMGFGFYTRM
jgi:hypothetical protein